MRWLAPGVDETRRPRHVRRQSIAVAGSADGRAPFEAWLYSPTRRPPRGCLLVVPGLHFLGPADPRLDRFLTVLAGAGLAVLAPFLPDFVSLGVRRGLVDDLGRAFDALGAHPDRPDGVRPGLLSISFGSLPALRLAAAPSHAERVGGLVVFGGYADWAETIRFCLTGLVDGRPVATRDPLNQPVVLMNVMGALPCPPADPARLRRAWEGFVRQTWGRTAMKAPDAFPRVARALLDDVHPADRQLFLIGCGVEPGALDLVEQALASTEAVDFLDPRPHLGGLACPVHLIHGRDDDVIPYTQLEALARAIPAHVPMRAYLTGLYAHTGRSGLLERAGQLPELAGEARTLVAVLRAVVEVATTSA
jgi:pimeloyl-ACP methyl ester carboxylesterase